MAYGKKYIFQYSILENYNAKVDDHIIDAVELMIAYLSKEIGIGIIQALQCLIIYFSKALLKNRFQKEGYIVKGKKLRWTRGS